MLRLGRCRPPVEEANDAGVSVYYVGVGPTRVDPLPEVFGPSGSQRIRRIEELPRVLAHVHRSWSPHDRYVLRQQQREVQLFEQACRRGLPVMLTGSTGCGKTRLVELPWAHCWKDRRHHQLPRRPRPARTWSAGFMVTGGDVVWTDGPSRRAVKAGAICYLDEVVEARRDSLAVLHSLTDHRRALPGPVPRRSRPRRPERLSCWCARTARA